MKPNNFPPLPTMGRLDDVVRTAYRTAFLDALNDGRAKPLLIPYSILGASILPALWLAIPHTSRPWVYQTRWLVMALVICFNGHVMRTASSTNFAWAYAAGLMASWGTIMAMNLLIWMRPQFDAARAIKVKVAKKKAMNGNSGNGTAGENGVRLRNGHANTASHKENGTKDDVKEEYQYIWQKFPEEGTFSERLVWAFDLSCSFRGAGWNHSIASIPRPTIPSPIQPSSPVAIATIPHKSTSGYALAVSETELLRSRIIRVLYSYLILDLLSVIMMRDPYFVLGPDNNYTVPSHLKLPTPILLLYRECLPLAGIWAALCGTFSLNDIVQYFFLRQYSPSRAALWHYPSTFGSFSMILDRGLAGWWGASWHQTFRLGLLGPSTYLLRKGYMKRGSATANVVGLFTSFLQSGLMHAAGSLTSIPDTKPWRSILFFLLQAVGIILQQQLALYLPKYTGTPSKYMRRTGNMLFCLLWLYITAPLFIDDLSSTGLWMFEPVPASPLRYLGFGFPGDHWWRWDRETWPKLYPVRHWWEVGIAL